MTKNKNKCLGFFKKDAEIETEVKRVYETATLLFGKRFFPCVPVSEYKAYKEKVKKVKQLISLFNGDDIDCDPAFLAGYKVGIEHAVFALEEGLGLSSKQNEKELD